MILAIMVNLVETGQMKSLLSVCGCLRILGPYLQLLTLRHKYKLYYTTSNFTTQLLTLLHNY